MKSVLIYCNSLFVVLSQLFTCIFNYLLFADVVVVLFLFLLLIICYGLLPVLFPFKKKKTLFLEPLWAKESGINLFKVTV
jgi:hypothetical protein